MAVNQRGTLPRNKENVIIIEESKSQRRQKPMTICIAIACDCNVKNEKGVALPPKVILVGDRMLTISPLEIEFEHPKTKLIQLTNNCAVATSGDALAVSELINKIRQKLKTKDHNPQIYEIATELKDAFIELRRQNLEDKILKPIGIDNLPSFYQIQQSLSSEIALRTFKEIKEFSHKLFLLIGGVDNTGAHIYAIDDPGVMYVLDDLGYDAIGSGETHALLTFIGANYHHSTSFEEALYLAYKAKRMSEKAPGIGTKYTDIWVIQQDAIFEIEPGKEIQEGDKKKKTGLLVLEEMYEEELKQTKIPFDRLAEIAKRNVHDKKEDDTNKSYC